MRLHQTALDDFHSTLRIHLASFLNFDFSVWQDGGLKPSHSLYQWLDSHGMNNPRGFKRAGTIQKEMCGYLIPIVEAKARNASSISFEESLVEQINSVNSRRLLERELVPPGRLGERWIGRVSINEATPRDRALGIIGWLLEADGLSGLKRCEWNGCKKFFFKLGRGPRPRFCGDKCRNDFNNHERLIGDRILSRLRKLRKVAKKKTLTEKDKLEILQIIGQRNFDSIKAKLRETITLEEIRDRLPQDIRERLGTPRSRRRHREKQQRRFPGRKVKITTRPRKPSKPRGGQISRADRKGS